MKQNFPWMTMDAKQTYGAVLPDGTRQAFLAEDIPEAIRQAQQFDGAWFQHHSISCWAAKDARTRRIL
jgi:hypothetical protein